MIEYGSHMNNRVLLPALYALTLVLGAWFIFVLPWHIPPVKRALSDSYNLGFTNAVATLGTGITLLLLTGVLLLQCKRRWICDSFFDRLSDTFNSSHLGVLTRRDWQLWGLFSFLTGAGITLFWLWLPFHYYGEMLTFIPYSEMILLGQKPYTQFHFHYGPLLVYLPVWFVWLSGGNFGVDLGYCLSLVLCSSVGLFLLAYCTTLLAPPVRAGTFSLLAIVFATNMLGMGLNYTALRFATPLAALLWLHCSARQNNPEQSVSSAPRLGAVSAAGATFCFAISPETGIAYFIGSLLYLGVFTSTQERKANVVITGLLGVAATAIFLLALTPVYFLNVWSFGSGAFNFPVVPSPFILFYLLSLAVVVPVFTAYGFLRRTNCAALAIGWAIITLILAAPALGRCDPAHVFCNGLGAFIGCFVLLQSSATRTRRLYGGALLLCFFFLPAIWLATYVGPILSGAALAREKGMQKADRVFWKPQPTGNNYDAALRSYPKIGTPLGCNEKLELYLKRTGRYVLEFYPAPPALVAVFTPEESQRKLHDLRRMPVILVPIAEYSGAYQEKKKSRYTQTRAGFLSSILIYPMEYHWKNEPYFPEVEWAAYIRQNFRVVETVDSSYLMVRK